MKGIADTGFLVAFANRNDLCHDWATDVASRVTEPLLMCEAVLAETAFHLCDVQVVLAMVEDGLVVVAFDSRDTCLNAPRWPSVTPTAAPTSPTSASCG